MKACVLHLNKLAKKSLMGLNMRVLPDFFTQGTLTVVHELLPPHTKLPFVCHKVTGELVFCLSGRFSVTLGQHHHSLSKGNIAWIPPRTWHQFATRKTSAEAISIFSPAINFQNKPDVFFKSFHMKRF